MDHDSAPETRLLETTIPLDRASVLVRAPLPAVLAALGPFAAGGSSVDATDGLSRGVGIDEQLPSFARALGRRAVVYRARGASYVAIIREGEPGAVHDVPLARRLSRELGAPAVALHVAARDVALELFHAGRSLESWLSVSGHVISNGQDAFVLDEEAISADPYGRALAVLQAYGFADDRLSFEDFARGDVAIRRWDVTLSRCHAFSELAAWPADSLVALAA